jgi:hypothetical protein
VVFDVTSHVPQSHGAGPSRGIFLDHAAVSPFTGIFDRDGMCLPEQLAASLFPESSDRQAYAILHATCRNITERSGRNTFMHGNVSHKCGGEAFDKAKAFAEGFRSEYHLVTNSCMMFAHKVNHAGRWSWFGRNPVWNSNPKAEMERGLLNNYITYNPEGDRFRERVWQISESCDFNSCPCDRVGHDRSRRRGK